MLFDLAFPDSCTLIPRRVYTQSHIDYVVEVILEVWKRRAEIRGLKLVYEAPIPETFHS